MFTKALELQMIFKIVRILRINHGVTEDTTRCALRDSVVYSYISR